jgi:hypothetical protein
VSEGTKDWPWRWLERGLLGIVAFASLAVAGGLVVYDVSRSPAREVLPLSAEVAADERPNKPAANHSVFAVENAARGAEMTNVTLFRTVAADLGTGRIFGIVTGLVYAKTNESTPLRQFCYLQVGNISAHAELTVSLATKQTPDRAPVPTPISNRDANAVHLPLKVIQEAAVHCRFV